MSSKTHHKQSTVTVTFKLSLCCLMGFLNLPIIHTSQDISNYVLHTYAYSNKTIL